MAVRHQREGGLRGELGLQPALTLLLDRIDPVIEFRLGLVSLPARLHQGDIGEAAQRKFPLDAAAPVAKAPEQGAGRLHQQVQSIDISNLIGSLCRFQRPNLHHRKHGATPPAPFVAP